MISDSNFQNDTYDYNPEEQVQKGPTAPVLLPGVYRVEATIVERKNRATGEPLEFDDKDGNKWPVYVIPGFEVLDPMGTNGRFDVWQDVKTIPQRFNENEPFVSEGAVVLTAVDAQAAKEAGSFGGAANALKEKVSQGRIVFSVSTGLTGTDSVWANAEVAKLGPNPDQKEVRKIWRKAALPTKTFVTKKGTKDSLTVYSLTAKSPLSGTLIKAKTKISRYLPSDMEGITYGQGIYPPKG